MKYNPFSEIGNNLNFLLDMYWNHKIFRKKRSFSLKIIVFSIFIFIGAITERDLDGCSSITFCITVLLVDFNLFALSGSIHLNLIYVLSIPRATSYALLEGKLSLDNIFLLKLSDFVPHTNLFRRVSFRKFLN